MGDVCLLARKWNLETRDKCSGLVLGTLALRIGDEMDVHSVCLWVGLEVDLDLGEEAEGLWGETEGDDTGDTAGGLHVARGGGQHDAGELAQARQDKLGEGGDKVVHLGALELHLDAERKARADPAGDRLFSPDDLHASRGEAAATAVGLAGDGSKGGNGVEEDAAVVDGVLEHGVEDDPLERDNVVWGGGGRGLLAETVAADGGVEAVFGVGVSGVESEADVARGGRWAGVVDVGHVYEVILEGGVVVVAETTWGGVAEGEVDVGDGEGVDALEGAADAEEAHVENRAKYGQTCFCGWRR